jgi:hypothetical protein
MRGFSKPPSKTITLTRGEESLELTLHAVPPGFGPMVRSQMTPPIRNNSGTVVVDRDDPQWRDHCWLLILGKSLEPSGVLETQIRAPWKATAEALYAEFGAAGLTDADLNKLTGVLGELSDASELEEMRGN